jgi:hypothetical protein
VPGALLNDQRFDEAILFNEALTEQANRNCYLQVMFGKPSSDSARNENTPLDASSRYAVGPSELL